MSIDSTKRFILEVCIASVDDACEAVAGGADRLELNMGLELGGLTPSVALLEAVKQVVEVPVVAMIRPRGAGFAYGDADLRVMLRDAETLLSHGADGIAWGALTAERRIHEAICRAMVGLAGSRETVFHRAFDVVADPLQAADTLADLGVRRIMTSGQSPTAIDGSELIARLQRTLAGRVEILPAAGVQPGHVRDLLRRTGCTQVHGSFRKYLHDPAHPVAPSQYGVTDRQLVATVRKALDLLRDAV